MSYYKSKRKVECAYCRTKIGRDKLKNHCSLKHPGLPSREKGLQDIQFSFGRNPVNPQPKEGGSNPDIVHDGEHDEDSINDNLSSSESEHEDEATIVEEVVLSDGDFEMAEASAIATGATEGSSDDDAGIALEEEASSAPTITVPLIDKTLPYPTDPAHFVNKPLTPELCKAILMEGPCQPGLNAEFEFPKNGKGRSFIRQWYQPKLKNGMKTYRDWLVYSPEKDSAYCLPCWLFVDKSCHEYSHTFSDPNEGFKRWRDGVSKLSSHENCNLHKQSVKKLIETKLRLRLGKEINQEQLRARERQVAENRKVLCRLIDATLFLAKQNLAFRGHKESRAKDLQTAHSCFGKVTQNGNFLELVKLLAKYDASLAHHLASAPGNASYLSAKIQNEFIGSVAEEIQKQIIDEVKEAHYFGVIMDSTIDISHVDQLSFCIRYIDANFAIQERFLLFTDIKKSDSQSLFDTLKEILTDLHLNIKLIRSQSYDGAANMSGRHSGLQTRVKGENSLAFYVHCCAHNLNLVLCDACGECTQSVTFFGTIQKLYNFFTKSQPRHNALDDAFVELNLSPIKLHKQCETRWYCKQDAVRSVKEAYPAILRALENLEQSERNKEAKSDIKGLLTAISNVKFLLMLEIWLEILTDIKVLSEYLQKKSMDLMTASTSVKSVQKILHDKRNEVHFNELLGKAKAIAEFEDLANKELQATRVRRRRSMPGEQARDEPVVDPKDRFRINVYYRMYDTLTGELESRFADFHAKVTHFACLMPQHIGDEEGFKTLASIYEEDVDYDLVVAEYTQFSNFYKESEVFSTTKPESLQDMLLAIKENNIQNAYPNLTVLYRIFGTIAISSATAERSFSRLKLIKSYLRSTMNEDRLSALALISIERDLAETTNYEAVIDTFASMSRRRIALY